VSDIPFLAQELVRLGTKSVFGIPGEGPSLLLLDELEKCGCAFHLVSHEGAGALAAAGFGRIAGGPGVSLSIKGPGFSNMLSGIASNWLDRNPVVSLSESYGPDSSLHRQHKRLDHATMAGPVVKAYGDNVSPELLPRLWDLCLIEEPGPVHLDISHTMQRTFAEGDDNEGDDNRVQTCGYFVSPAVASRIDKAQRPVVIAGGLATRRPWFRHLANLRIPVFTTFAGKGAYDETLPYSAGVFTNSGGPVSLEREILPKSDLIVGLGLRTTEILEVGPLPAPLIAWDEFAGTSKGLEPVAEEVGGTATFLQVIEQLGDRQWGESDLYRAKEALAAKLNVRSWLPAGVFHTAQEALPDSTLFVLDTGSFCTIGEHTLRAQRPLHVIGSALARSMGVAIPMAVGAGLAARGTPVVVATGDGGIRMYPETISIAVREKLPMLVLLMADGFLSSVRQSAFKTALSQKYLRIDSSCWKATVQAWGCPAERIESLADLESALMHWKQSPGPLLMELPFDADQYMLMTDGIR
jgi:acetolactate synthase I/II/III large subunit